MPRLKCTRPPDPLHHTIQSLQPLKEAARRHPARLDDLTVFVPPNPILVADAPIQTRTLICVDTAQPRADELLRVDHHVDLLRVEP